MALSLGVSAGSRIRVGNTILKVDEITNGRTIALHYGNKPFVITEDERTEVEAGVFLFCGATDRTRQEHYTRLAFEAPREIKILRMPS